MPSHVVNATQALPDALRGEQWAFVQLPLGTLKEMLKKVGEVRPHLDVVWAHPRKGQLAARVLVGCQQVDCCTRPWTALVLQLVLQLTTEGH